MSVTPGVSSAEPDTSDPRAELRRKLAKQNNEIFASLSSSISSTFALKRRIGLFYFFINYIVNYS